jgi:hypothetical protein
VFAFFALLASATFPSIRAQPANFAGVMGGISSLKADAITVPSNGLLDASAYKPENGPALRIFAGRHLSEYLAVEIHYGWIRNRLTLSSIRPSAGANVFHEQDRSGSQHTVMAEMLLYFRRRGRTIRPYLSAGGGPVFFRSGADTIRGNRGMAELAPGEIHATKAALRVAVGIDIAVGRGWALRYSFSESILNGNPISERLTPAAKRDLANFENLVGFVKTF